MTESTSGTLSTGKRQNIEEKNNADSNTSSQLRVLFAIYQPLHAKNTLFVSFSYVYLRAQCITQSGRFHNNNEPKSKSHILVRNHKEHALFNLKTTRFLASCALFAHEAFLLLKICNSEGQAAFRHY